MTSAYLSLGSNLGNRLTLLVKAVCKLENSDVRVTRVSSVYETAPQGKTDQPQFLNIAVALNTELDPLDLLRHIQYVEQTLGRVRHERWGPRSVDIDLVLYGDLGMEHPDLVIPHPRMRQRAFVLTPLLEINPSLPFQEDLVALSDQGVALFLEASSFAEIIRGVK